MSLRTLCDGDGRALGRLSRVKNRRPIARGERPVVDPTSSRLHCSIAGGSDQPMRVKLELLTSFFVDSNGLDVLHS